MAFFERGKRSGTGAFKDSFMRRSGRFGRRKEAGEICPEEELEIKWF